MGAQTVPLALTMPPHMFYPNTLRLFPHLSHLSHIAPPVPMCLADTFLPHTAVPYYVYPPLPPPIRSINRMVQYWRIAGLSYVQFSRICAQHLQRILRPEQQALLSKRGLSLSRIHKWQDGHMVKSEPKK